MKKKTRKTINKKSTARKTISLAKKSFCKACPADIKTLGLLATALVIVVFAALFIARLSKGTITENGANNQSESRALGTGSHESEVTYRVVSHRAFF